MRCRVAGSDVGRCPRSGVCRSAHNGCGSGSGGGVAASRCARARRRSCDGVGSRAGTTSHRHPTGAPDRPGRDHRRAGRRGRATAFMIVSQHTPNSSANCDTGRSSAPTRRPAAAPVRRSTPPGRPRTRAVRSTTRPRSSSWKVAECRSLRPDLSWTAQRGACVRPPAHVRQERFGYSFSGSTRERGDVRF